jgi:hypothetical protein
MVLLEQDIAAVGNRILSCLFSPQGGSITLPDDKLTVANFPGPNASLTVYSAQRVGIGAGRAVYLRYNATDTSGAARIDRMNVMFR